MAKDNIGLLNEISASLKKMNQTQVRQNLEAKEYQERQLAQAAGGEQGPQGPNFIDPAEDFRRRVKGSVFSAKLGEKFTESGLRAKRSNKDYDKTKKKTKLEEKQLKEKEKGKKIGTVLTKDKRVGLSTVVNRLETLSLIKVNTDALVQMLGGIRTHLGMSNKATEAARKKAMAAAINVKRTAEENKREAGAGGTVAKMSKISVFAKAGKAIGSRSGLMGLLIAGVIAAAGMGIKNMIEGWKTGGFMGAIKAMFFGNGEGGLGNAIAAAFSTGATFATAGLLIAGPVGALVGGIIGMAIGALTGWLGAEKVTAIIKGAGQTVVDGITGVGKFIAKWAVALGHMIYKPGVEAQGGHQEAIKARFFGVEVNWTMTGLGEKFAQSWIDGKAYLKEKFLGWALKIYNPTTNEVLGGLFTMPTWFDEVEEAVSKVWNGVKDFGKAIKNAVILLLPDVFTDFMGWTNNGMIIGAGANHSNYEAYNDGSNFGVTMAAASQVSAFQPAVKQQMDYINSFSSEGRKNRFDLSKINDNMMLNADGDLVPVYNNKMKTTGHSRIRGLSDESATELLRQRDMRLSMSGYGMRTGGVNITTDASSNTGAVIVNNNYMESGVSTSNVDIHTHMDGSFPGGREIPWHLRGGYN